MGSCCLSSTNSIEGKKNIENIQNQPVLNMPGPSLVKREDTQTSMSRTQTECFENTNADEKSFFNTLVYLLF